MGSQAVVKDEIVSAIYESAINSLRIGKESQRPPLSSLTGWRIRRRPLYGWRAIRACSTRVRRNEERREPFISNIACNTPQAMIRPGMKGQAFNGLTQPETRVRPSKEASMEATYSIVRSNGGWAVEHDGSQQGNYATKEAAFEAAAGAASNAIKIGLGVIITVPHRAPGETAMGGKP
jgi:hypothetical protein